jgi:hypothetical protein
MAAENDKIITIGITAEELLPNPIPIVVALTGLGWDFKTCKARLDKKLGEEMGAPCLNANEPDCGHCRIADTDGLKIKERMGALGVQIESENRALGRYVIVGAGDHFKVEAEWDGGFGGTVGLIAYPQS